jgi:hypothetical protein
MGRRKALDVPSASASSGNAHQCASPCRCEIGDNTDDSILFISFERKMKRKPDQP